MSISEFFNKKARAAVAAVAMLFGAAGGYVGAQVGNNLHQPGLSTFALDAKVDNVTEKQFISGRIPGYVTPQAQKDARAAFTQRVTGLAQEQDAYWASVGEINRARAAGAADNTLYAREAQAMGQRGDLVDHAVKFVSDLRLSTAISESDYKAVLDDYNARVGLDVTPLAGNYTKGIAFNQECHVVSAFSMMFDDDDMTDAQVSADIGSCMADAQHQRDTAQLEGGAAGFALGGLAVIPLWRRRKKGPSVFKSKKP